MLIFRNMPKELDIKRKMMFYENIKRIVESLKMVTIARLRKKKELLKCGIEFYDHVVYQDGWMDARHIEYGDQNGGSKHIALEEIDSKRVINVLVSANQGLCGNYISGLGKLDFTHTGDWILLGHKLPLKARNLNSVVLKADTDLTVVDQVAKTVEGYDYMREFSWEGDKCRVELVQILDLLDATAKVNRMIIEALVVEETKRLIATDQASKNGQDAMAELKKQLNKVRQEQITNELNEIISGCEYGG